MFFCPRVKIIDTEEFEVINMKGRCTASLTEHDEWGSDSRNFDTFVRMYNIFCFDHKIIFHDRQKRSL